MKKVFRLILVMALGLGSSVPAFSQADVSAATIKGTITDQNNAVIAGATITSKSADRGVSRIARTDREGDYQIPSLQPGTYEITVEATGFETKTAKEVRLTVGQTLP